MDPLSLISFIIATPTVLIVSLSQIYLWQRKEYRWDRVLAALSEPAFTPAIIFITSAVILWFIAWVFSLYVLAVACLVLIFIFYGWRILSIGLYRPQWTHKAILLSIPLGFTLIPLWLLIVFSNNAWSLKFAALIILIYPLVAFATGLVNALTNPAKRRTIIRSQVLRQRMPNLSVVGITGSYGKTTTKHILSHLIPSATTSLAHRNSDYVIALDMQQQLKSTDKFYLVEMSAYRPSEIRDLAQLTRPTIGVITHIGNQHLALFGSQARLVQAKWELIDALPKKGIAILNADDPWLVKQAQSYHGLVRWFSTSKPADVWADNISYRFNSINFNLHLSGQTHHATVPLLSEAYLSSILAAVCTAQAVGLTDHDIISRLSSVTAFPRTMELAVGLNSCSIIDDSYSANEQSVLNAIRHLQRFPQSDRRIVMVPLIELGASSAAVHQRIGQALKKAQAQVYIYGRAWHNELGQPFFTNPRHLIDQVAKDLSANSVVLLEGRIPEIIRYILRPA